MEKKSNKPLDEAHDQPPQDEATRNKIDKHLSDIDDTISEEDLKNINTVTGAENDVVAPNKKADEKNEIDDSPKDDNEPEKEAPTPWEILS